MDFLLVGFLYELVDIVGRTFVATGTGTSTAGASTSVPFLPYHSIDDKSGITRDQKSYDDVRHH